MQFKIHYHIINTKTQRALALATWLSDYCPRFGDKCTIHEYYHYKVVKVYEPFPSNSSEPFLFHVHVEVIKEN
jgi:hypothetical protein